MDAVADERVWDKGRKTTARQSNPGPSPHKARYRSSCRPVVTLPFWP